MNILDAITKITALPPVEIVELTQNDEWVNVAAHVLAFLQAPLKEDLKTETLLAFLQYSINTLKTPKEVH